MAINIDALKSLLQIVKENVTISNDGHIPFQGEDCATLMEKNHHSVITKTYAGQCTKHLTLFTQVLQRREGKVADKLEIYISKHGDGNCKLCIAIRNPRNQIKQQRLTLH